MMGHLLSPDRGIYHAFFANSYLPVVIALYMRISSSFDSFCKSMNQDSFSNFTTDGLLLLLPSILPFTSLFPNNKYAIGIVKQIKIHFHHLNENLETSSNKILLTRKIIPYVEFIHIV